MASEDRGRASGRRRGVGRISGVAALQSLTSLTSRIIVLSRRHNEMAFKSKAVDSKTVFLNLLLCLLAFYSLFYMIGSVCFGAFRLDYFDGRIPFDFKTKPEDSVSKYLVNLLSLELTYFCSGLVFAAVVKSRVWDYALTVTCLHVVITSLVMLEFPLAWQWWVALGGGLFLMICNGQLIAYFACQDD